LVVAVGIVWLYVRFALDVEAQLVNVIGGVVHDGRVDRPEAHARLGKLGTWHRIVRAPYNRFRHPIVDAVSVLRPNVLSGSLGFYRACPAIRLVAFKNGRFTGFAHGQHAAGVFRQYVRDQRVLYP
jgi:hypothetical protein